MVLDEEPAREGRLDIGFRIAHTDRSHDLAER